MYSWSLNTIISVRHSLRTMSMKSESMKHDLQIVYTTINIIIIYHSTLT